MIFAETPVQGQVELKPTGLSGRVRALATTWLGDSPRVYVGGKFKVTYNGIEYRNLVAFDLKNAAQPPQFVPSFKPQPDGEVWALAVGSYALYLGGTFTKIGTATRRWLGAVDFSTGLPTSFRADVAGDIGCETCTPEEGGTPGVHALANTWDTLLVGGNFLTIQGQSRPGLGAVDPETGAVDSTRFTIGVKDGFVASMYHSFYWNVLLIGGTFSSIENVPRQSLAMVSGWGEVLPDQFQVNGKPVLSVSADVTLTTILAGTGGKGSGSNQVYCFADGTTRWIGPVYGGASHKAQGDIQSLLYVPEQAAVYFGFHDGLFINGEDGKNGDPYKLAALDIETGQLLNDASHTGPCDQDHTDNCWLPPADPAGSSKGFMGVRALAHTYTPPNYRPILLVGGEVNAWSGLARTRYFATFPPAP